MLGQRILKTLLPRPQIYNAIRHIVTLKSHMFTLHELGRFQSRFGKYDRNYVDRLLASIILKDTSQQELTDRSASILLCLRVLQKQGFSDQQIAKGIEALVTHPDILVDVIKEVDEQGLLDAGWRGEDLAVLRLSYFVEKRLGHAQKLPEKLQMDYSFETNNPQSVIDWFVPQEQRQSALLKGDQGYATYSSLVRCRHIGGL